MDAEVPIHFLVDQVADIDVPASQSWDLVGHNHQLDQLCGKYAGGKLHHAWLVSGPRGIGKATLAFRFAAHVLRNADPELAPERYEIPSGEDVVARRIAGGGHPNLLYLARPWDEKQKKYRSEITVDTIRKTVDFFGTTTGEAGWRVCIVDAADEMNRNAANALLKVLEEPPPQTIFLVLSHASGRLLPTIKSRCQRLQLDQLDPTEVLTVMNAIPQLEQFDTTQKGQAADLASGSVRKAIELLINDGLQLQARVTALLTSDIKGNWPEIHALAAELASKNAEHQYRLFLDQYFAFVRSQAGRQGSSPLSVAHWVQLWEKANETVRETETYNLDKKQMILSLFERMRFSAA